MTWLMAKWYRTACAAIAMWSFFALMFSLDDRGLKREDAIFLGAYGLLLAGAVVFGVWLERSEHPKQSLLLLSQSSGVAGVDPETGEFVIRVNLDAEEQATLAQRLHTPGAQIQMTIVVPDDGN